MIAEESTNMELSLNSLTVMILQVLWSFRMMYDYYISGNSGTEDNEVESLLKTDTNTKRHIIQLITQERNNARPVCYMKVQEIISPDEEDLLRRACAKGVSNDQVVIEEPTLPEEVISRKSFTDIWLDSVNMVA